MKYKKYSIFIICGIAILLSALSIMNYYNKNVPKNSKNSTEESKEQGNNSSVSKEELSIPTITSITNEPSKDSLQNQFGNLSGNLSQGGSFAGDDNFIYFSLGNYNGLGFYSARPKLTTAFNKIGDLKVSNLNILNNHIYYIKGERIMSSLKNGKEEKLIYRNPCNSLFVYNSRLYVQTFNGNKLISLNDQGEDEEVIIELNGDSFITFLYAKGDTLYFAHTEFKDGQDSFVISSYNMNSKKMLKLHSITNNFLPLMQMDENYIYFLKSNPNNSREQPGDFKLLRLNVENKKVETVIEKLPFKFPSFIVKDDIVYYTAGSTVYKHLISENKTTMLYKNQEIKDLHFESIYILNDRLYIISGLYSSSESVYIVTLKTNGSDVVIVE